MVDANQTALTDFEYIIIIVLLVYFRPPFAECITQYFRDKVPTVIFTTNPVRIKYCTKTIVVFREDIMTKLCRNSIYFPTSGDIPKEVITELK